MMRRPTKARDVLIEKLPTAEFRLNVSAMSRHTGIPVTTLWDAYRQLRAEGRVRVTVTVTTETVAWTTPGENKEEPL